MVTGLKFIGGQVQKVYSPMFNNMANVSRIGLITGCAVSAGSGMSVNISTGKVFFGSTTKDVVAVTGLAITTNANVLPRKDLVVVDNAGTVSVIVGTPNTNSIPADYDNDLYVVLAMVDVIQSTSSIVAGNITDIRVLNQGGSSGSGSGSGSLGTFTQDFTSQTTVTVTHRLNDINARVEVINASKVTIVPSTITRSDANTVVVTFGSSTSGTVLVTAGIGLNNGYYKTTFTSQTTVVCAHNLQTQHVTVVCYNGSNVVIAPSSVTATDANNATVVFGSSTTGTIIITGGVSSNRRKDEALVSGYENKKINATSTSSSVTFTNYVDVYNITISNAGTKTAFIKFGATAVTTDFPILPKTKLYLNNVKAQTIAAICGGSDTTSLYIQADLSTGGSSRTTVTQYSLACTQTTANQAISVGSKKFIVMNYGDNNVYHSYTTTATLNDMVLFPYDYKEVEIASYENLSGICDTSLTSSLRVLMFG